MVENFSGLAGSVHIQVDFVFAHAANAVELCHAVAAADIHTDLVFHDLFQIGCGFTVELVAVGTGADGGTADFNFRQLSRMVVTEISVCMGKSGRQGKCHQAVSKNAGGGGVKLISIPCKG